MRQAGLAGRTHPSTQPEAGHWRHRAAPAPGTSLGLGPGMGLWVDPAAERPWPGKGGLWEAGARPCYGLCGAGAGGPGAAVGPVQGLGRDKWNWWCPWGPDTRTEEKTLIIQWKGYRSYYDDS